MGVNFYEYRLYPENHIGFYYQLIDSLETAIDIEITHIWRGFESHIHVLSPFTEV